MTPLTLPAQVFSPQEAALTLVPLHQGYVPSAVHDMQWHSNCLSQAETEGYEGKGCALHRRDVFQPSSPRWFSNPA